MTLVFFLHNQHLSYHPLTIKCKLKPLAPVVKGSCLTGMNVTNWLCLFDNLLLILSTEELKIKPSLTVVITNVFNPCATPGSLKTCFRLRSKTKIFLYFPVTTTRKKIVQLHNMIFQIFPVPLAAIFLTIFTLKVTVSILICWIQRGHLLEIWNLKLLDFQSSPLLSPFPFAS